MDMQIFNVGGTDPDKRRCGGDGFDGLFVELIVCDERCHFLRVIGSVALGVCGVQCAACGFMSQSTGQRAQCKIINALLAYQLKGFLKVFRNLVL